MRLTLNSSPRRLAALGLAGVIGLVPLACSDAESSDETSLTSMASDVALGGSFVATYFNAERFADGADIDWQGDNDELTATWTVGRPEVLLGEPFRQATALNRSDIVLFDFADVNANCGEAVDVDVEVDGLFVHASCAVERALWASFVLQQDALFPPLFGTTDDT